MSVRDHLKSVLRSRPVTALSRRLTRDRLRILGYHGVSDPHRFEEQMNYLVATYRPVSQAAVIEALRGETTLPDGAVWVTFDDGDPSVVNNGLATLVRLGIPSTMFICPGLIQERQPFWWRLTDWATEHRPHLARSVAGPEDLTEFVKLIDDDERRQVVADIIAEIETPFPDNWRQLNRTELDRWRSAGLELGNHTWDHPCLDRCSPGHQRAQIQRAHEWLSDLVDSAPIAFAYPNGNFSAPVDHTIDELQYQVGLLYDHNLTRLDRSKLQLSRLRIETHHSVGRQIGIMSGAQPMAEAVARRLIGRPR